MKFLYAILIALCVACPASAGWFAEITFAPSAPRGYHPPMVYRGDYVPYDIAYPNSRPAHPCHPTHPRAPQYRPHPTNQKPVYRYHRQPSKPSIRIQF